MGHGVPRVGHGVPRVGHGVPRVGHGVPRVGHGVPRVGDGVSEDVITDGTEDTKGGDLFSGQATASGKGSSVTGSRGGFWGSSRLGAGGGWGYSVPLGAGGLAEGLGLKEAQVTAQQMRNPPQRVRAAGCSCRRNHASKIP